MRNSINWRRLLEQHRIPYDETGHSVAKGNINVKCPFCGQADPSFHMGINLTNSYWGCWRNKQHRGKSPVRLAMKLFHLSFDAAREMLGLDNDYRDPDEYEEMKQRFLYGNKDDVPEEQKAPPEALQEFRDFQMISEKQVRTHKFFEYLADVRGFGAKDVPELARQYHLRAAVRGAFKDRVIIPYYEGAQLLTWTGRAVGSSDLRYKDLSIKDSLLPPKRTFYNYNATQRKAKILLVAEGPVDALKLDFYGRKHSVRTVALSTNSITDDQVFLLETIAPNFEQVLMLMDNGNSLGVVDSFRLKEQLVQIKNVGFAKLPLEYKDGGEMPPKAIDDFCRELIHGNV